MSTFKPKPTIFEPHGMFGAEPISPADGPWPFGYISAPNPTPIFALEVPLQFDEAELLSYARVMAAAPELYDALRWLLEEAFFAASHVSKDAVTLRGRLRTGMDMAEAALAKARGEA